MTIRSFDARRLNVAAFAKQGGELSGEIPLPQLPRLAGFAASEFHPGEGDQAAWRARGELRAVRTRPPQVWLHLQARVHLHMACQRCLQSLPVEVVAERSLRFVDGEDAAAAEDAQSEDDVLALTTALDLHALIEDELVLSLPWVPRHALCPRPLPLADEENPDEDDPSPHPFAALAQLKKKLDS